MSTSGWDAVTVADALDALAKVPAWQLSSPRWDQVGVILDRMTAALAAGDAPAVRDAVIDLELSGPLRIEPVGARPRTGMPDQVVERRDKLVHTLSKEQPPLASKDSRDAERPR